MRVSVQSLALFLASAPLSNAFISAPRRTFTNQIRETSPRWSSAPEDSEEDGSSGASKFKELLERAKEATPSTSTGLPPTSNPLAEVEAILKAPTEYTQPPPPSSPQQLFDQYGNPVPLPPPPQYYDQYGNPVPSAAAAVPPPPPPTLPSASAGGVTRTKAERKTGRNRDADSISNTADIYFAQLKRDSTVRTAARQAGDLDTANQAMAHPDIEKMKDLVNNQINNGYCCQYNSCIKKLRATHDRDDIHITTNLLVMATCRISHISSEGHVYKSLRCRAYE
uniref:Uncharacterized protein n=1 Tax=Ditylum brightwellii TaxID=49249 RepID=A0A7S4SJS1_9STRA